VTSCQGGGALVRRLSNHHADQGTALSAVQAKGQLVHRASRITANPKVLKTPSSATQPLRTHSPSLPPKTFHASNPSILPTPPTNRSAAKVTDNPPSTLSPTSTNHNPTPQMLPSLLRISTVISLLSAFAAATSFSCDSEERDAFCHASKAQSVCLDGVFQSVLYEKCAPFCTCTGFSHDGASRSQKQIADFMSLLRLVAFYLSGAEVVRAARIGSDSVSGSGLSKRKCHFA
jgi:hypothetical protein